MYNRFTILLSASVPSEKRSEKYKENYTKIKNAQIQIEEAVIGLARNIFQANGKIIFGGHPSISPLVAMVATEFRINKEIENSNRKEKEEKPINIFQSKAHEMVIPHDTTRLFDLGYSDIIWTDAIDGEEFNPKIVTTTQCEKSLDFMRRQMMQGDIDALVCIGGMEGVEKEFELFRELHPHKPIYLLKSTGGASKILAERFSNSDIVRIIDGINSSKRKDKFKGDENSEIFDIIPYSFISALIVNEIIESKGRR
ncbi:MAG: hypothetical protein KAY50_04835 [Chitinophagaceae bacterium]|nr:hypothetical protein [Chitinophagaceae bacterium]